MPFSRNILTLVNEASASSSLTEMTAIFGTAAIQPPTDETARRLKSVIHDAISYLNRETIWPEAWRTAQFTVPTGQESVPFPTDMDRIRSETFYSSSHQYDRVHGATTGEAWRYLKSGNYSPFVDRFRLGADRIFVYPVPANTVTFDFEYVSSFPWVDINSIFRGFCESDDYRSIIDDNVLKLELKWRILREFGDAFDDERREAERVFETVRSQKGAAPTITYGRHDNGDTIGYVENSQVVLG